MQLINNGMQTYNIDAQFRTICKEDLGMFTRYQIDWKALPYLFCRIAVQIFEAEHYVIVEEESDLDWYIHFDESDVNKPAWLEIIDKDVNISGIKIVLTPKERVVF